uniref:Uncharacterized protein n=1 Tax=Gadus morhua TaxID=8049 RepID=A0A8C4YU16_GADMO
MFLYISKPFMQHGCCFSVVVHTRARAHTRARTHTHTHTHAPTVSRTGMRPDQYLLFVLPSPCLLFFASFALSFCLSLLFHPFFTTTIPPLCSLIHLCSLNGPIPGGPRDPRLSDRTRLALRMLPSELGLPLPWRRRRGGRVHCSARRLGLIIPLLALMWFARLYLHYCSQWLFLQAMAVPVNKFEFHAHTVDLVYQNSLLHTREELALVVAGPLTLNAVTFLLVLIRRGCQQIFGSLPSFTSDFIMAQGVWTVLDPGAVLAVDAVLGRLAYSPDRPVGDAAKLYWHFLRNSQSGAAGVVITLFLYAVLLLLSVTILFIYLLRFHNDGRMLDTFQRLSAREGDYFLPRDLELSNQELSHIVKKAEQWRGFNGERRKVAVSDYIWAGKEEEESGELSTHVSIYTLYLSGLRQRYRHFLRQADGSIVEVRGTPVFIRSSVHTHVHVDVKDSERGSESIIGRKGEEKQKEKENLYF